MALLLVGANGTVVQAGVEHQTLRIESRPVDAPGLGSYSYGGFSGIVPAALAANSEIFQFRWADATRFAMIRKIKISAAVSTTFFAAGVPMQLDLIKSTGWTVQGTGGVSPAPSTGILKKRTSMGSSLVGVGDMRIASTAALGAGTKTLETAALSALAAACPITASLKGDIIPPGTILFQNEIADGVHPLILSQNEGISIRSVAVPATGTWTFALEIQWAELAGY